MNKHLSRAMTLQHRLSHLEEVLIQSSNVLDLIELGLVMFGADRKLEFINSSAQHILDADDGLSLTGSRITIRCPKAQEKFRTMLGALYREDVRPSDHVGGMLTVPRRSRWNSYTLTIIPMRDNRLTNSTVTAVGFIFDPRKRQANVIKLISNTYGFTPVEAALANALMQGQTLAQISEGRGVSYNTVKTHLHSVFSKTDTKRQAELISLLLSSLAGLNISD